MSGPVVVRVNQGLLRGFISTTKWGNPFINFLGIPYALPPTGNLRFKPPQVPEPWSGIRDAISDAPVCVQENVFTKEYEGQEDCLYLNVYTSGVPSLPGSPLKPVMVWIHGGGFTVGSGNRNMYGGDYLVDSGVVVVTINYRLNVFGFLSLDNEDVPGNMGLKDQVMALQWVRNNISVFGGDPDNITLFGESAGGAAIQYLLLSPLSNGLFHKAIMQSGTVLNPWAFSQTNRKRAFQLGEHLGCSTNDAKVLLKFLMNVDAMTLIKASLNLISKNENLAGFKFPFLPSVEPVSVAHEAFLYEHPLIALKAGRFQKVPVIIGSTSHEGIISLRGVKSDPERWEKINKMFNDQLSETLNSTESQLQLSRYENIIRKLYFKNKPICKDNLDQFISFQSDLYFIEGILKSIKYMASLSPEPTYCYEFKFDGDFGLVKALLGDFNVKGASHADDLVYLFHVGLLNLENDPLSLEMKTLRRMVKMWTNFAKTGNPTCSLNEDINIQWRPYNSKDKCYLCIDDNLSMKKYESNESTEFWENICSS